MRSEPKKRIDTRAAESPRSGLNPAFAGIDLAGVSISGPSAGSPISDTAPSVSRPHWKMGRVVLRREKAHRGGKTVIVVDDFATHLPESVIECVAKRLRAACGCGGTVKGRTIEVQGDQAGKVRALLEEENFTVAGIR